MRRSVLALLACAIGIPTAAGCLPAITLHHRSQPAASDCQAEPSAGAGAGLLDVRVGTGYTALISASAPVPVTLESAVVSHLQDGEELAGLPSTTTPRLSVASGHVDGDMDLIVVELVTPDESVFLSDGVVGAGLQAVTDRVTLTTEVEVTGGSFTSNTLTLDVDLCRGCLVPDNCQLGELLTGACLHGQDQESTCVDPLTL